MPKDTATTSVGFVLVFLLLILNIFDGFFCHSVFIVHFEQVNAGCVQNMYVSCRLKNHILATTKTRKGVTLYEVKHQNNVEVVLVLCCLSLNFCLASISLATLNCILFTGLTLLPERLLCSNSLETRESRTLSCIFS